MKKVITGYAFLQEQTFRLVSRNDSTIQNASAVYTIVIKIKENIPIM